MGRIEEMIKKAESCDSHNNETGKCLCNGYAPLDCLTCKSYIKRKEKKAEPYKGVEQMFNRFDLIIDTLIITVIGGIGFRLGGIVAELMFGQESETE